MQQVYSMCHLPMLNPELWLIPNILGEIRLALCHYDKMWFWPKEFGNNQGFALNMCMFISIKCFREIDCKWEIHSNGHQYAQLWVWPVVLWATAWSGNKSFLLYEVWIMFGMFGKSSMVFKVIVTKRVCTLFTKLFHKLCIWRTYKKQFEVKLIIWTYFCPLLMFGFDTRTTQKFEFHWSFDNTSSLVPVIAWRWTGNRHWSKAMLIQFTDAYMQHWGRWVKWSILLLQCQTLHGSIPFPIIYRQLC